MAFRPGPGDWRIVSVAPHGAEDSTRCEPPATSGLICTAVLTSDAPIAIAAAAPGDVRFFYRRVRTTRTMQSACPLVAGAPVCDWDTLEERRAYELRLGSLSNGVGTSVVIARRQVTDGALRVGDDNSLHLVLTELPDGVGGPPVYALRYLRLSR